MNLAPRHHWMARGDERLPAIIAVIIVHLAIGLALIRGLAVHYLPPASPLTRLIELTLPPVPPPPPPPEVDQPNPTKARTAAAPALPAPKGGPKGPAKLKTVAPDVTRSPITTAPAPGGGAGSGTAAGTGAGGGTGGNGNGAGADDGGSELEQIAGSITNRDYPRALGQAGVGGTVELTFMVEATGQVGRCAVTRSSGSSELDQLTCRLVQQRFRFRPATDRSGRPIAEEVDLEHVWDTRRR
ncbi:MAG: energy transducer TonB [Sphingomicrobium sp.]